METQKNQVADSLKQATNILVTVSTNPSVDQLAGAIGLTLLLNKLGKHATAVFSGAVPSTIEFLQPEKTLEKNTDSLRDFIIALDKSKADKLRYKVEDQMVKIFITPYRTSINDKDLEFSQGDFNVEVVLALGVIEQKDLDQAITAHGRILHDAAVIGVSAGADTTLGSINWNDHSASSLCEMLTQLGLILKADALDSQMSTALLTGIVAETSRFSNEKTSSETMQISAKLMAAGANQQLVATQLQPPTPIAAQPEEPKKDHHDDEDGAPSNSDAEEPPAKPPDGTLLIEHEEQEKSDNEPFVAPPEEPEPKPPEQIHIDDEGRFNPIVHTDVVEAPELPEPESELPELPEPPEKELPVIGPANSQYILDPPTMGGALTANSQPDLFDTGIDNVGAVVSQVPLLSHDPAPAHADEPVPAPVPAPTEGAPSDSNDSLPDLEPVADQVVEPAPTILPEASPVPVPEPAQASEPAPELQPFTPPAPSPDPMPPTLEATTATPIVSTESADTPAFSIPEPTPLLMTSPTDQEAPQTLADLEQAVASANDTSPASEYEPHVSPEEGVDAARDAVYQAMSTATSQPLGPVMSLNAQPMDLNLSDVPAANALPDTAVVDSPVALPPAPNVNDPVSYGQVEPSPSTQFDPSAFQTDDHDTEAASNPNPPPIVPPPLMPPIFPPAS